MVTKDLPGTSVVWPCQASPRNSAYFWIPPNLTESCDCWSEAGLTFKLAWKFPQKGSWKLTTMLEVRLPWDHQPRKKSSRERTKDGMAHERREKGCQGARHVSEEGNLEHPLASSAPSDAMWNEVIPPNWDLPKFLTQKIMNNRNGGFKLLSLWEFVTS